MTQDLLATITAETFRPYVGQTVTMAWGDVSLVAEVAVVEEEPKSTMPGAPRTAFTVLLTGPADAPADPSFCATLTDAENNTICTPMVQRIVPPQATPEPKAWFQISFQ